MWKEYAKAYRAAIAIVIAAAATMYFIAGVLVRFVQQKEKAQLDYLILMLYKMARSIFALSPRLTLSARICETMDAKATAEVTATASHDFCRDASLISFPMVNLDLLIN